jgi:hypothetical protein
VSSNPTQGMDVCVCVVLCIGSGLATGLSLVQGALPCKKMITELKTRRRAVRASGGKNVRINAREFQYFYL